MLIKLVRPRLWIVLADILWIMPALVLARVLHTHAFPVGPFRTFVPVWLVAGGLWSAVSLCMRLDQTAAGDDRPSIIAATAVSVSIFTVCALAISFLAREPYSRMEFFYVAIALQVGFSCIHLLLRSAIKKFRSLAAIRTVVLGTGNVAREVARKIKTRPEFMRELVGFLYPANHDLAGVSTQSLTDSVTVAAATINTLLRDRRVDELILTGVQGSTPHTLTLVEECRRAGVRVSVVPSLYDLYSSRARIIDLDGLPIVTLEGRESHLLMSIFKSLVDMLLIVPLTVVALPFVMFGAIGLVLRGRKPFRWEQRCGLNGIEFRMWRMNMDRAAAQSVFEHYLVCLSITELPQLLNVWKREMSLVGPRPESPERVKHYSEWHRRRLSVRPGITGAAQVNGLREEHPSEDKARYDLHYIYRWSPVLDFSLLLQTIWTLATRLKLASRTSECSGRSQFQHPEISLGESNVDRAQSGAD